ncbi:MAG: SDR family NAD(P)-dependent oxidoreductase [Erysipelotrichaceae bacterium]|nr:SDR family NAD(P)-dependent oxidoreductase [Erysipelotrichaceae bacterium]
MEIANKNVLITGVSGGIGFEIAKKFIIEGYQVIGLDINPPKEDLDGLTYIKTDVTKEKEVISAFNFVKEKSLTFSNIISAAGIYNLNSLIEMNEEEFIRIFDINVFSLYRVNKIFLPLLDKGGKIFMISSELAPLDPLPFTGIYGISKSLVEKYAYSLRMELQLLDYKVIVIRPGAIDTGLLNVSQDKLDKFVKQTEHYKTNSTRFKKIVDSVENKKIAPSKIANLIYKVSNKKRPKYVYKINRNKLLILLSILPKRTQNYIIRKILQ